MVCDKGSTLSLLGVWFGYTEHLLAVYGSVDERDRNT